MSNTIHGGSHSALKHFRKNGAALAVYWEYISRTNYDNVSWPSLNGLAKNTGFSKQSCLNARHWLIEHGALERVEGYIRPQWRGLSGDELTQKLNLDQSEYYRPTGIVVVGDKTYKMLYFGSDDSSQ